MVKENIHSDPSIYTLELERDRILEEIAHLKKLKDQHENSLIKLNKEIEQSLKKIQKLQIGIDTLIYNKNILKGGYNNGIKK